MPHTERLVASYTGACDNVDKSSVVKLGKDNEGPTRAAPLGGKKRPVAVKPSTGDVKPGQLRPRKNNGEPEWEAPGDGAERPS